MDFWTIFWRNEGVGLVDALIRSIPGLVGIIGAAGVIGYSPLGRGLFGTRQARDRTNELLDGLGKDLKLLGGSLTDISDRLEATEHHLRSLEARRSLPKHPTPV